MNVVAGVLPVFDVLFDLSQTDLATFELVEHIRLVLRDGELSPIVGVIHLALPPQVEPSDIPATYVTQRHGATLFRTALDGAAYRRRPLLVLSGLIIVDSAVIAALFDALASESLIGSVQPRFADAATDLIYPLPNRAEPCDTTPSVTRQVLARLPASIITAELPAACLLLRYQLAGAVHVPSSITSVFSALGFGLCQARRCGFRNLVLNWVITPTTIEASQIYPRLAPPDASRLAEAYPDVARAALEIANLPQRRLEMVMGAAWPARGGRRCLLVDCRGLIPLFNGTAVCVLGLLDGIAAANWEWRIDILCSPEAAEFHSLSSRYPDFALRHGEPSGAYAAALMLNQPWHVSTVASLHRHALVIAFNILDTIAWDVLYPVDDHVAPAWRLIARHADGLAFISRFSKERFQSRFPISPAVVKDVAHLSLRTDELTLPACRDLAEGNHILLFGNDYDHKALAPTLRILSEAFPLQPIVVLGGRESENPLIRAVQSGSADGHELHSLIATARAVVYPSFYEGFGLPAMEGLAYGRPVVVRRSPLWEELSGHTHLPGRLLPFDDAVSLVDTLGRVLEGLPVEEIPMGTRLSEDEPVTGWKECATRLLALLDRCLANACAERWIHRHEVLEG
jgi:glycosyltransferase involved in cell wall biosynthesis